MESFRDPDRDASSRGHGSGRWGVDAVAWGNFRRIGATRFANGWQTLSYAHLRRRSARSLSDSAGPIGVKPMLQPHRRVLTPTSSCLTVAAMRTTLVIEDDVLEAARSLAEAEGKSVGEVISTLARRGLAPQPQEAVEGGFPVFTVSPGAKPITLEMVQRALEES